MMQKRNPAIVCCRTASMLMIVLCHIIHYYTFIPGHRFLSEVFNVGVYTFLAISGWLYGTKTVTHFLPWIRKRCLTLLLPAVILSCAVLTADRLAGIQHNPFSMVIHLLNLSGLGFLWPGFYRYFSEIIVLGPLWFLTIIMLCYCLIPLLQRLRPQMPSATLGNFTFCAAAVAVFALYYLLNLNAFYFLTFIVGYALATNGSPSRNGWTFLATTGLMLVAQALRLILRALCDGTVLYQSFVPVAHMILGIWILCCFFRLSHSFPNAMATISGNKVVVYADGISFYIYLMHCCFCRGPLNLYALTDSLLVSTALFVAATLLSAVILKWLVKIVHRAIGMA